MEAANGRSMTALKIFSMTLTYFKVMMHHDGDGDQNDDSDDYDCLEMRLTYFEMMMNKMMIVRIKVGMVRLSIR